MADKKNKGKRAAGFETFNKSQQIYKLLEKGIIESEALTGNSTDRPGQEDHIANLLESAEAEPSYTTQKTNARPSKTKKIRTARKQKKPRSNTAKKSGKRRR